MNKLSEWLGRNGRTLEQASEITGISVAALSRINREIQIPTLATLRKLKALPGLSRVSSENFYMDRSQ